MIKRQGQEIIKQAQEFSRNRCEKHLLEISLMKRALNYRDQEMTHKKQALRI